MFGFGFFLLQLVRVFLAGMLVSASAGGGCVDAAQWLFSVVLAVSFGRVVLWAGMASVIDGYDIEVEVAFWAAFVAGGVAATAQARVGILPRSSSLCISVSPLASAAGSGRDGIVTGVVCAAQRLFSVVSAGRGSRIGHL
jgi:hypothetical protein